MRFLPLPFFAFFLPSHSLSLLTENEILESSPLYEVFLHILQGAPGASEPCTVPASRRPAAVKDESQDAKDGMSLSPLLVPAAAPRVLSQASSPSALCHLERAGHFYAGG